MIRPEQQMARRSWRQFPSERLAFNEFVIEAALV
jgi:hypothetical protein